MKTSKALLAYLLAGAILLGSSCSDDDSMGIAKRGYLTVGDKIEILRSGTMGLRPHQPHLDANGNTYYIHTLAFTNVNISTNAIIGKITHIYINITSSSPTGPDSVTYNMLTDLTDIYAGQIITADFSIDGGHNEKPEDYTGFSYKMSAGTATLAVQHDICTVVLTGTVDGNSEKTNHETAELIMTYDGILDSQFVIGYDIID
jgi:hypothetical protein